MTAAGGSVLLRARTVLTAADGDRIADGAVLLHDGIITRVDTFSRLREQAEHVVDAGTLLMPGMVDAHSHLRGIPLVQQGIPPRPLETWLCSLSAMTPLHAGDEAVVAAGDLLETGITAVQGFVHVAGDVHAYREVAEQTTAGVQQAGIRALLILGHTDRAERAPEPAEGEWALVPAAPHPMDAETFAHFAADLLAAADAADCADSGATSPRWGVGPVGAQWSTDAALTAIAAVLGSRRSHTHLNESRAQRDWLRGQPPPAARLAAAGLFDDRLSAAHAVHLTDEEIDRAAAAGVALVHCPASNRALSVGTARVARWLRSGVTAALGLDSQNRDAPDVFAVMREALRSAADIGEPLRPDQVLALATSGGGAAIGISGLGRLTPGALADLVSLDLLTDAPDVLAVCDEVVGRGSADAVRTVWVGGVPRVRDGRATADIRAARDRLRAALDADRSARDRRLSALAPVLAAVELATLGTT